MRIAIVGSRSMPASAPLKQQMLDTIIKIMLSEAIYPGAIIVSGGADGVDALAEGLARGYGNPCLIFKPEWTKYGKTAGFKRNQKIVDASDQIIAFHYEGSRGTADTIARAKAAGKPLTVYTPTISEEGVLSMGIEKVNHE